MVANQPKVTHSHPQPTRCTTQMMIKSATLTKSDSFPRMKRRRKGQFASNKEKQPRRGLFQRKTDGSPHGTFDAATGASLCPTENCRSCARMADKEKRKQAAIKCKAIRDRERTEEDAVRTNQENIETKAKEELATRCNTLTALVDTMTHFNIRVELVLIGRNMTNTAPTTCTRLLSSIDVTTGKGSVCNEATVQGQRTLGPLDTANGLIILSRLAVRALSLTAPCSISDKNYYFCDGRESRWLVETLLPTTVDNKIARTRSYEPNLRTFQVEIANVAVLLRNSAKRVARASDPTCRPVVGMNTNFGTVACANCGTMQSSMYADAVNRHLINQRRHPQHVFENFQCMTCAVKKSGISIIAESLQNQVYIHARLDDIFVAPSPSCLRYVGTCQIESFSLSLGNNQNIVYPSFPCKFWVVPTDRCRSTLGLITGLHSPRPSAEVFNKYVVNRDTLGAGIHVVLWEGEAAINARAKKDSHSTSPSSSSSSSKRLEILAVVDYLQDLSTAPRSERQQRRSDAEQARRNGQTATNESEMQSMLCKRYGAANGLAKSIADLKAMEVALQYESSSHLALDVSTLRDKYSTKLDDYLKREEWKDLPKQERTSPVTVPMIYPRGHDGRNRMLLGKPTEHAQPPQRPGTKHGKLFVADLVCTCEAARDHAIKTMQSRVRSMMIFDQSEQWNRALFPTDIIDVFCAYRIDAVTEHLQSVRCCLRRLKSSNSQLAKAKQLRDHKNSKTKIFNEKVPVLDCIGSSLNVFEELTSSEDDVSLTAAELLLVHDAVLLELKASSGETDNYFATRLHHDGCTSQSFETATSHYRSGVPFASHDLPKPDVSVDPGGLIVPGPQVIFVTLPGEGVLHVHLVDTLHASSPGRDYYNMVRLCGPRGSLGTRASLT